MSHSLELTRESIGLAIRTARQAMGYSLREMSELTGIAHAMLSRTELGERDVGYVELLVILGALETDELTLREYADAFARDGMAGVRENLRALKREQRSSVQKHIAQRIALQEGRAK
jgi:transcriptional regulator with XRE-family HTH domain